MCSRVLLTDIVTLFSAQDIPTFPVVDRLLIAVKERMNLAREIDRLELMCRRDNAQKGWLHKAVEDMDLLLDEDQMWASFCTVFRFNINVV